LKIAPLSLDVYTENYELRWGTIFRVRPVSTRTHLFNPTDHLSSSTGEASTLLR